MFQHGAPFVAEHRPWTAAMFVLAWSFFAIIAIRTLIEPSWGGTQRRALIMLIATLIMTVVVKTLVKDPDLGPVQWGTWWVLLYSTMAILLFNAFIDPHMYWLRWSTWWIGDAIAVPLFVYFASKSLQGYEANRLFDTRAATAGLMVLGLIIGMALWITGMSSRGTTWANFREASEFYHTIFVWTVFVAIVGHALLAVLANRPNSWSRNDWGWVIAVVLFLMTLSHDTFLIDATKTGR